MVTSFINLGKLLGNPIFEKNWNITGYKKIGYITDALHPTAHLFFAFLCNCTTERQVADSVTVLTLTFHKRFDAWCSVWALRGSTWRSHELWLSVAELFFFLPQTLIIVFFYMFFCDVLLLIEVGNLYASRTIILYFDIRFEPRVKSKID